MCKLGSAEGDGTQDSSSESPQLPADALPFWAWLVVATRFWVAFVTIFVLAPFSKHQAGRFGKLGHSAGRNPPVAGPSAGGVLGLGLPAALRLFPPLPDGSVGSAIAISRVADASGHGCAAGRVAGLEPPFGHEHCVPVLDGFDSPFFSWPR